MFMASLNSQPGQRTLPSQVRAHEETYITDQTGSLLAQKTWAPSTEHDQALIEKLKAWQPPIKHGGRGMLAARMGSDRVVGDVLMERLPDGLRAAVDETTTAVLGLGMDEASKGDKSKAGLGGEGSGLPGQKKRKVQELADAVDKGLVLDHEVETVSICLKCHSHSVPLCGVTRSRIEAHFQLFLNLADEQTDTVCQISIDLARHRKSSTIDRKDVQLAYGAPPSHFIEVHH